MQRFVSRHVLTPEVIVGTRLPAYCTSSGLAILSALPEDEARAVLSRSNRITYTQYTQTDPDQIMERLARFRQQGYAHTEDEMYLGDIATAVAVLGADGRRAAPSTSRCRARAGTPRGRTAHFRAADGGGTRDLQPGMIP